MGDFITPVVAGFATLGLLGLFHVGLVLLWRRVPWAYDAIAFGALFSFLLNIAGNVVLAAMRPLGLWP